MIERTDFVSENLPVDIEKKLKEFCRQARGDILLMTTLAGSGHPGGSMSSLEIFSILWSQANINPANPGESGRDRIVISHGHTSPAVYAVLGRLNFFDLEDALISFRMAGSHFEGHIERSIPGIELTTGNLGQGFSAGCGLALADRSSGIKNNVWIVTGDGEQQKGQNSEARRFASKEKLKNLTVIVDNNGLQISGKTDDVMSIDLRAEYLSSGWDVVEIDGHNLAEIYRVVRPDREREVPRLVIAKTVMGKGISFMENNPEYHGKTLKRNQYTDAVAELDLPDRYDEFSEKRDGWKEDHRKYYISIPFGILNNPGTPVTYPADFTGDNRSAFGKVLLDLARSNRGNIPLVFDCDLADSVRTAAFAEEFPDHFFQCGIQEHHTVTAAGAASIAGRVVFLADFGVFAIAETFNQHRLNDINMTNLKVIATHCGLDVGSDGKTHHCIKFLSLTGSLNHYATIIPVDPNHTDKVIRYIAMNPGNFFIAMGRSKTPVIKDESGNPFFSENYRFVYGKHDLLRTGSDVAIVTMGCMCHRAVSVREILEARGVSAAVYAVNCPLCMRPGFISDLRNFQLVVSYEDHDEDTGLGAKIALAFSSEGGAPPLLRKGVTNYGLSGSSEELYKLQGLMPDQVAESIYNEFSRD